MKKAILVLAVCITGLTSVKAQVAKGNLFIGTGVGTTNYNSNNYNYNYSDGDVKNQDQKNYSLSLSPQVGVFVTNHLIFGGMLSLAYDHDKNNVTNTTDNFLVNNTTTNATTFSAGPFLRYYFFDSQPSKTLFFIQAETSVGTGSGSTAESTLNTASTNVASNGNTSGMFIFNGGGSLGLTHFIEKNMGLDVRVGYAYNYEKYTTTLSNETTTSGGVVTNNPSSYKATLPQNGLVLSAGFHFFLK